MQNSWPMSGRLRANARPPGREEALPALRSSEDFPPRGQEHILLVPVLLCALELGERTGSIPPDPTGPPARPHSAAGGPVAAMRVFYGATVTSPRPHCSHSKTGSLVFLPPELTCPHTCKVSEWLLSEVSRISTHSLLTNIREAGPGAGNGGCHITAEDSRARAGLALRGGRWASGASGRVPFPGQTLANLSEPQLLIRETKLRPAPGKATPGLGGI